MQKNTPIPAFDQIKKVHILGVCGTLMGAFAAYLRRRGFDVTGSDQNVYPPMSDVLREAGVRLLSPYDASNLDKLGGIPDLVIVGNVISAPNPEIQAVIAKGLPYTSLPEALEKLLLPQTTNLVVCGTHGKTTTSSLLAHTLVSSGRDPSYFIGGVSHDLPFSFQVSSTEKGKVFVLEGDEYDTAFWDKVPKFNHYLPDHAILTSVEYDHADIYPDFQAVVRAFEGLIDRIRPGGHLIASFDYPVIKELVRRARVPVISYGDKVETGARFIPGRVEYSGDKVAFEILDCEKGAQKVAVKLTLHIPGKHNILNAIATWIECKQIGLTDAQVAHAFDQFKGVKRRQEVRAEVKGITVIDDFAHHPTAVRETLRALKLKYAQRRVVAVFEPRSATSRRKIFQKDYVEAFSEGDAAFIAVPYDQTKIPPENQFSSAQLVDDLNVRRLSAHLMNSVDEGVGLVAQYVKQGDVVAVLSNGGFGGFIPSLISRIKEGTK